MHHSAMAYPLQGIKDDLVRVGKEKDSVPKVDSGKLSIRMRLIRYLTVGLNIRAAMPRTICRA